MSRARPPRSSTSPRTTWTGHGSLADYAADKGRIYEQVQQACVYNVADPVTERLVREADVVEGSRAVGFTLGTPAVGMVGLVEDVLADRAFIDERENSAAELCTVADLASPAPHIVANALAAAALARAYGVPTAAVRDGLRSFVPDGHRIADAWPTVDGVRYVDDSKATNPHAAAVLAAGLRPGRVGRRRARQGGVVRRPGAAVRPGCGASCCWAATAR